MLCYLQEVCSPVVLSGDAKDEVSLAANAPKLVPHSFRSITSLNQFESIGRMIGSHCDLRSNLNQLKLLVRRSILINLLDHVAAAFFSNSHIIVDPGADWTSTTPEILVGTKLFDG